MIDGQPQCVQDRCQAPPRWSVSEHLDRRTDYRVCGRHLSWFVSYLNKHGFLVVVVTELTPATEHPTSDRVTNPKETSSR